MTADRRTFLKQAAATAAATAAAAIGAAAGAGAPETADAQPAQPSTPAQSARTLGAALLAALGEAVLPESLGTAGRASAVRAFEAWIAGYRPVTEEMHGYGDAEITYTPPDPAPGWRAQLEGLDLLARRKHGRGFVGLDLVARRALLAAELPRSVARLPGNPLGASHVAIALLSHWAASSGATDLVYGARIGRATCRVLAESPRKPLPLARGGGG